MVLRFGAEPMSGLRQEQAFLLTMVQLRYMFLVICRFPVQAKYTACRLARSSISCALPGWGKARNPQANQRRQKLAWLEHVPVGGCLFGKAADERSGRQGCPHRDQGMRVDDKLGDAATSSDPSDVSRGSLGEFSVRNPIRGWSSLNR